MQQKSQRIHPKIPYRPQEGGEGGKKQHPAAQHSQQDIQSQLALGPVQRKQKHHGPQRQAVDKIQRNGQARIPKAEGPEQVIE